MATAATPSLRPVRPKPSVVVAITVTEAPAASLRTRLASARRGENLGRLPISCTLILPISKPAARTIAAASERMRTPDAPAISGRSTPKLLPKSPVPEAAKSASAAACATTSPSECPLSPRSSGHVQPRDPQLSVFLPKGMHVYAGSYAGYEGDLRGKTVLCAGCICHGVPFVAVYCGFPTLTFL